MSQMYYYFWHLSDPEQSSEYEIFESTINDLVNDAILEHGVGPAQARVLREIREMTEDTEPLRIEGDELQEVFEALLSACEQPDWQVCKALRIPNGPLPKSENLRDFVNWLKKCNDREITKVRIDKAYI